MAMPAHDGTDKAMDDQKAVPIGHSRRLQSIYWMYSYDVNLAHCYLNFVYGFIHGSL